jgi:oleate hydratase
MIRDGEIPGHNITTLGTLDRLGGSLDGSEFPSERLSVARRRMLEGKYRSAYDLFGSIPTLEGTKTVTQEIFDWNETMKTSSKARLVRVSGSAH